MINLYAQSAYANGLKHLQAGRWPYIQLRLKDLEKDYPGITAEVMTRIAALKATA
jgi:hypothetical protein